MSVSRAVLVIAGTDSSGGAGLARDLSTLIHFQVPAMLAVTAVTAQSAAEVRRVHHVPPAMVHDQIVAALATHNVGAIKIGMLGTGATVEAVTAALQNHLDIPVVLDPVLAASSGGELLDDAGRHALRSLLPRSTLLTPNLLEAAALLKTAVATTERELHDHAKHLLGWGPSAVLLKGGHALGTEAVDTLYRSDGRVLQFSARRMTSSVRGSGCGLASGIAAGLAQGKSLEEACSIAKSYVSQLFEDAAHGF